MLKEYEKGEEDRGILLPFFLPNVNCTDTNLIITTSLSLVSEAVLLTYISHHEKVLSLRNNLSGSESILRML